MAMSSAVLSATLQVALGSLSYETINSEAGLAAICDAIAESIVAHITTNAIVVPTGVPVPMGVTVPPGGPIPVVGTGLIT